MQWLLLLSTLISVQSKEVIKFPSADGIMITADLYAPHGKEAPMILLFHQANWSRGEYLEIAPRLNEMGFNCLAVDLRSGGTINNVANETKNMAVAKLKATEYHDALPDMIAAINYADKHLATGKLIVWGSSYSSALALKVGADMPQKIDAILAFSPGEYFTSQGKPRDYITSSMYSLSQPVFFTSAHNEKSNWWGMYVAVSGDKKKYFWPSTTGNHGSRALWPKYTDSADYWKAVKSFLESI
jgi:pimeloyl-ACP methyl ester carboxylesterase